MDNAKSVLKKFPPKWEIIKEEEELVLVKPPSLEEGDQDRFLMVKRIDPLDKDVYDAVRKYAAKLMEGAENKKEVGVDARDSGRNPYAIFMYKFNPKDLDVLRQVWVKYSKRKDHAYVTSITIDKVKKESDGSGVSMVDFMAWNSYLQENVK